MSQYLLDTNICIFYLKGKFGLINKMASVGFSNCFISEITVLELKYGAACSDNPEKQSAKINQLIKNLQIVPISSAIDIFPKEKALLRRNGLLIDDFDLLIGATAVANNLIMVTNNTKHFDRISKIRLEDWTL